ncbi:MAG: NRDE family protein [Burkholderiales bacterium]
MCLIILSWQTHQDHRLIVAANRDEFHARPAAPAAFWRDRPEILAGRDLEAMGTWMGVSRSGRFAAVTNYRGAREPSAEESRGVLVSRFLGGETGAGAYMAELAGRAGHYSGFNLVACDGRELWWMSNRNGAPRRLDAGHHALGNLLLDSDDVQDVKRRIAETPAAVEPLFSVLASAKIVNPQYGTRCSSVLLHSGTDVRYAERSFAPDGSDGETVHFQFSLQG